MTLVALSKDRYALGAERYFWTVDNVKFAHGRSGKQERDRLKSNRAIGLSRRHRAPERFDAPQFCRLLVYPTLFYAIVSPVDLGDPHEFAQDQRRQNQGDSRIKRTNTRNQHCNESSHGERKKLEVSQLMGLREHADQAPQRPNSCGDDKPVRGAPGKESQVRLPQDWR